MSLSLLQSYSSAEEEEEDAQHQLLEDQISSDEDQNDAVPRTIRSYKPLFDSDPPSSSSLPSALDAFSEVIIHVFDFFFLSLYWELGIYPNFWLFVVVGMIC